MGLEHNFTVSLEWVGNRGTGTSGYREYGREHVIRAEGKTAIEGSADRVFHGNADRWNPEQLLIAALSQCHLLSYLYVAVAHGVVVTGYTDRASGIVEQNLDGSGQFSSVTLRPTVTVASADQVDVARGLHGEAAKKCFIANSVNFPVTHEPVVVVA